MGFTAAAAVMAVVSTAMTVSQQQQQADSKQALADYQAQVADNNRIAADQQAQYALSQGQAADEQQRQKTAQLIGAARAQMAAHGVELDSGSPLDIQSDDATMGELNALSAENSGEHQAYGYQVQAMDDQASAGLYGAQAAAIGQEAKWQKTNTLLNASESMGSNVAHYFADA